MKRHWGYKSVRDSALGLRKERQAGKVSPGLQRGRLCDMMVVVGTAKVASRAWAKLSGPGQACPRAEKAGWGCG